MTTPNQYNAANFTRVPKNLQPSREEAQPSNKVFDLQGTTGDAKANLNARPTPGSGLFFGTSATTTRAVGRGAWHGGTGSSKIVDRDDAPVKNNTDPNLQSNV